MKKILFAIMALAMTSVSLHSKTLVVYYSFTNNCRTIATDLKGQLADADLVEVQPAEEGLDYAANGYALGSSLIQAIRNNPNDASAYPAVKDVTVDFSQYDAIVIATPLWWSNMAAPMQTFLFKNGSLMAGKRLGLIVSSSSSGISGVEADAKRLVAQGIFAESLWIRSSQTGNCHSMIASWLSSTGIGATTGVASSSASGRLGVSVGGNRLMVTGDFSSVDIYDTAGRKLLSSANRLTDISGLSAASVYVAVVRNGNECVACKFAVR